MERFAIKILDVEKTYSKSKDRKQQKALAGDAYRELIFQV